MSGGYTLHDIDLFAPGAETLRLAPQDGAQGIGCILRDGHSVVGYRLIAAQDIPAGGVTRAALLTEDVQRVLAYLRLSRRIPPGPPPESLSVSVAICTKDRPDWLRRLLASLARQKTDRTFEIVVVDNNSESPEVRRIAEASGARYVRETKTGLDFARNAALREASGDIVAFLDDDTTAEPEWYETLCRVWAENPDAGCVTGLILPMSLETEAQVAFEQGGGFRRALLPDRHGRLRWKKPMHPCGAGEFGAGANMSLDRRLVLGLGGFDEALDTGRPLPGGGDLDIFYRVVRSGRMLVYDPGVVVRHDHRRDMEVLRHQYFTWGLGLFAYLEKSKRSDPDNAAALTAMGRWFWLDAIRRLLRSLLGRAPCAPRMIMAEMKGALQGRFGEYDRSEQRSEAIRRAAE